MALIRPISNISASIDLMNPDVSDRVMTSTSSNSNINNVGSYKIAIIGTTGQAGTAHFAIVDIQNGTVLDVTNTVTINAAHDTITITHSSSNVYHYYYLYS